MNLGLVAVTVFLVWHGGFEENDLLKGKMCFVNMFMRCLSSCVTKHEQNDFHFQCRIICTALADCPRNDTFSCNIPLRVHQLG